jgi:hypothetical protein
MFSANRLRRKSSVKLPKQQTTTTKGTIRNALFLLGGVRRGSVYERCRGMISRDTFKADM